MTTELFPTTYWISAFERRASPTYLQLMKEKRRKDARCGEKVEKYTTRYVGVPKEKKLRPGTHRIARTRRMTADGYALLWGLFAV